MSLQGVWETRPGKWLDWFICIVHAHIAATSFKMCYLLTSGFTSIIRSEHYFYLAGLICRARLCILSVTISMLSHDDRLSPVGDIIRNVRYHDRLPKYYSFNQVANGWVGASEVGFKTHLVSHGRIRSYGCTLNSNCVFLKGKGSFKCDFVIR